MIEIPESFLFPAPWIRIRDDYIALNPNDLVSIDVDHEIRETPLKILNDELHRETPVGHVLYGLATEVVAVCTITQQDFVYVTEDPSKPLAIVHLTWSRETDPFWPRAQVFSSLQDLEQELRRWAEEDFWV